MTERLIGAANPDMINPPSAKAIDADAASWAARMDRGLSPSEETQLEAWLASNSRHIGALARARAIWCHAEQAGSLAPLIDLRPDSELSPSNARFPLSRRNALLGIGGALAASAAALVLSPLRPWSTGHNLGTGIGEIRRVPLPDGSVVTLDTATSLTLRFTDTERRVLLHAGGAYFETAADHARPFIVEAGVLSLEAGAAAFSVHALSGVPVTVLVARGVVSALVRGSAGHRQAIGPGLRAMQSAGLPGDAADALPTRLAPLAPAELDRLLSWRQGQLAFEGETLGHAAETFRRYASPAIEIDTPPLANEPITGLFAATDPAGFADAIALSLNARVSHQDGVIRLTR